MTLHPKVVGAAGGTAFAEAIVVVVLWPLQLHGVNVPDDVAAAFSTILGTVFAVIGGYNAPNPAAQQQNG